MEKKQNNTVAKTVETDKEVKQPTTLYSLIKQKNIQSRFISLLGAEKYQKFSSSLLQIVNSNLSFNEIKPMSIINAAITSATLDLPLNKNLGFAWIVPYKGVAQFQIGWKGFVQLALRSGFYKKINTTEVYENQFNSFNNLTEELDADFTIDGTGKIVGYAAYFELTNGMIKTCFWSKNKVVNHAKRYSKTYGKKNSVWNEDNQFDAMARKTVLKNTLSKWGILSVEMQLAQVSDQSAQINEGEYIYVDNYQEKDKDSLGKLPMPNEFKRY